MYLRHDPPPPDGGWRGFVILACIALFAVVCMCCAYQLIWN